MKARQIFVILGGVILLLLLSLVALAVYFHREEEREKNRAKTAPARAGRQAQREEPAAVKDEPIPEPDINSELASVALSV